MCMSHTGGVGMDKIVDDIVHEVPFLDDNIKSYDFRNQLHTPLT